MFSWVHLVAFCLGLAGVVMMAGVALAKKSTSESMGASPFECGFTLKEEWRKVFSVRFYVLALIFLIFDVELIILFPALIFVSQSIVYLGFLSFVVLFLGAGLVVEWNKMILDWVY